MSVVPLRMNALRHSLWVVLAAVLAAATGCERLPSHPPETVVELDDHLRSGQQEFPARTIVMHNVRRVTAGDLTAEERLESLRVVERMDRPESPDTDAYAALASALGDSATPNRVRLGVLGFLVRRALARRRGETQA